MNWQKYFITLVMILGGMCITTSSVHAKLYKPLNDANFNRVIAHAELALVLFYKKESSEPKDRERIRALKDAFTAASHEEPMVSFIRVNVGHDKLLRTARTFYATSQEPLFILFYRGKPFKHSMGGLVEKSGHLAKDDIVDFVEDNFSHHINAVLLRERRREERKARRVMWDTGWYAGGYGPYYNGYEMSNYWWGNGYFPSW